MSTKSTIFLTYEDEHWFSDCGEILQGEHNAITLEFNKQNIRIDCNDEECLVITITNPHCDLYHLFNSREFKDLADK